MSKIPRGVRNNNPGNIRHGSPWVGMAEVQADPSFVTFRTPEFGIRAMARILVVYQTRYKLTNIRGIIHRWAPPVENDTDSYVNSVARSIGVGPDDPIDVKDPNIMLPLARAIIWHENGQLPYSDDQIREGMRLAQIE